MKKGESRVTTPCTCDNYAIAYADIREETFQRKQTFLCKPTWEKGHLKLPILQPSICTSGFPNVIESFNMHAAIMGGFEKPVPLSVCKQYENRFFCV